MNKYKNLLIVSLVGIFLLGAGRVYYGATNFDRLVLGEGNFGTDPNTTYDITFQNDEGIENGTDGRIGFGAANLLTTGTLGSGAITSTAKSTLDSLKINGRFMVGMNATTGQVTLKASSTVANILELYRGSSGTVVAKVDTSGNLTAVAATFTGAITATSQTIASGAITSSSKSTLDSLKVNGRFMVGMDAITGQVALKASNAVANILELYRGSSATAVAKVDTSGNLTAVAGTFSGLATFAATGQVLALRTIAAGDSVFLKSIVDAADTTLKVWNGTAWVTVKDLIP